MRSLKSYIENKTMGAKIAPPPDLIGLNIFGVEYQVTM